MKRKRSRSKRADHSDTMWRNTQQIIFWFHSAQPDCFPPSDKRYIHRLRSHVLQKFCSAQSILIGKPHQQSGNNVLNKSKEASQLQSILSYQTPRPLGTPLVCLLFKPHLSGSKSSASQDIIFFDCDFKLQNSSFFRFSALHFTTSIFRQQNH